MQKVRENENKELLDYWCSLWSQSSFKYQLLKFTASANHLNLLAFRYSPLNDNSNSTLHSCHFIASTHPSIFSPIYGSDAVWTG